MDTSLFGLPTFPFDRDAIGIETTTMSIHLSNQTLSLSPLAISLSLAREGIICVCVCKSHKTLGQPKALENDRIWLKFCTIVLWVNICGRY